MTDTIKRRYHDHTPEAARNEGRVKGGDVPPAVESRVDRRQEAGQMKTFTVSIDARLDRALDDLRESLGKTSRADVFRLAVTLLKLADEARQRGQKLAIADQEDKVLKEILIPG